MQLKNGYEQRVVESLLSEPSPRLYLKDVRWTPQNMARRGALVELALAFPQRSSLIADFPTESSKRLCYQGNEFMIFVPREVRVLVGLELLDEIVRPVGACAAS